MKKQIILAAFTALLIGCDSRVVSPTPEKVTEKNTTIINPPAKEEKRVEINVNPSGNTTTEEKKTTTTNK